MAPTLLHHDHHDFGPTERELAHVLRYIDDVAHYRTFLDDHTPLEEYQDRGRDALSYAWQGWDSSRGIPFYVFARTMCWRKMRGAATRYQDWRLPGRRCLPDAGHLTHGMTYDSEGTKTLTCDPPESLAWFFRDIARHWPCMAPGMRQTLRDTLADLSPEEIAARDQVVAQTKHIRFAALVAFLRRHVYDRMTSCQEEVQSWQHGTHARVDPAARRANASASKARWVAANRERHLATRRAWRQRRKQGVSLAAAD